MIRDSLSATKPPRRRRAAGGVRIDSRQHWHLLAYDVRDDGRLRKTAKILEGYGQRLQYSVFRCKLSDKQLERLRWELSRVMAAEDSLLIVPLCDSCSERLRAHGPAYEWPKEPPGWVII